jgi:hypothetical protein
MNLSDARTLGLLGRCGPSIGFAKRLAAQLAKGDFIPSKHGNLSAGYDLWARHANGDVIVHCGGNAGWFDWFTPVARGDEPDFVLVIEGRDYRLVRGVDEIPEGFSIVGAPGHGGLRRVGRPSRPPETEGVSA